MHAVAAAGVVASALPTAADLAAVAALILHAVVRRPPPPPRVLLRHPDGRWSLTERASLRLALGEGTSAGPFWVLLRLGAGPDAASVLLLRDQLPASEWRALQAAVRRAKI